MLYPAVVVSHPFDRKNSQGWGTEVWGTAILELLQIGRGGKGRLR
jgi:hypothetical protein